MQRQANRIDVGHLRYGVPERRKRYMTRLKLEVKAYIKTGNIEHLFNAANYCALESMTPEHKNFHENIYVDSVTRGKV